MAGWSGVGLSHVVGPVPVLADFGVFSGGGGDGGGLVCLSGLRGEGGRVGFRRLLRHASGDVVLRMVAGGLEPMMFCRGCRWRVSACRVDLLRRALCGVISYKKKR